MHWVSPSPQRACQRKAGASLVVTAHGIRYGLRQPVAAVAPAAATCPVLPPRLPTLAFRSIAASFINPQLRDAFACRSLALKGEVLVGLDDGQGDALYDMFSEPSHDLRELCSAQLRQLFAVLSRVSPSHSSSCKACVYARRADSFNTPQIKLQQVACWPSQVHNPGLWAPAGGAQQSSGGGSCSSFEELDDLLILHTPPWEAGSSAGSSTGNGVGCDTEASLCQEEVVLLPSSNMLVLPLAEAGVLVGLLVVELATSGRSSMSVVEAAGAVGEDEDSSTGYGPQQQQQQQSWASAGLPEDALWCLRNAVLPLAKACAMDLRHALAGAQQEAQQRLARSLLDEARGPLKVLGTFGQMLAPRLRAEDGKEPESDMAEGMVLQGQRLADVVQQLEAALRPGAAAAAARAAGRQQLPRQQLLALPWAAGATAVAGTLAAAGDETGLVQVTSQRCPTDVQQQLQQQQPWALSGNSGDQLQVAAGAGAGISSGLAPPAKASSGGRLPERCTSSSSSSATTSNSKIVAVAADDAVVHLPGQGTAASLVASSRDIRWEGVYTRGRADASLPSSTPSAAAAAQGSTTDGTHMRSFTAPTKQSAGSRGDSHRCDACYGPSGDAFDVNKTIELVEESGSGEFADAELGMANNLADAQPSSAATQITSTSSDSCSKQLSSCSRSSSSSSSATSSVQGVGGSIQVEQHQARHQQRNGSCNVLEVLSSLLAAAAQLAAVQEVNLIANDPLQLDNGTTTTSSSGSSSSSNSASTAAVQLHLQRTPHQIIGDAVFINAGAAAVGNSARDAAGAASSLSGSSSTYTLLPRPVRPLLVGIAAATCKRVLGYVLDVALQCTPRGGQLCVTARQGAGGVEVKVLHTGQASPSRLHTTRQGLGAVSAAAVPAPAGLTLGPVELGPLQPGRDVPLGQGLQPRQQQFTVTAGAGGRKSSSARGGRGLQELAAPGSAGSNSSSRLVSLDFATQLLQAVGGRLSVAYPEQFMNAISGQLEVGSSIEVWLPPPAPSC